MGPNKAAYSRRRGAQEPKNQPTLDGFSFRSVNRSSPPKIGGKLQQGTRVANPRSFESVRAVPVGEEEEVPSLNFMGKSRRVIKRDKEHEVKMNEEFNEKRGQFKHNINKRRRNEGILESLTEEERLLELQSQKSSRISELSKFSAGPPPINNFLTDKVKKDTKKQKPSAPEFTEEESKLADDGKFTRLLATAKSDGGDFLKDLQKSKITKDHYASDLHHETSLDTIDLDQSFDTGLKNNFEEFDESKNFKKQRKIVEAKYKNKKFPIIWDEDDIIKNIEQHLHCVPKILSGKISSPYYAEASDIAKASASTHLSSAEFMRLPISHFTIGFYGVKRQAVIASIIKRNFEKELEKAQLVNQTMKFWSLDSFVLYVLSCEVAVRMASKDLKISAGEALDLLEETVDYGKYITDPVPVQPASRSKRTRYQEISSDSEKEDDHESSEIILV